MMSGIQIGTIKIYLYFKNIKNLYISVLPPIGIVRVSAPLEMSETVIRMSIIHHIPWIKKQQKNLLKQTRKSRREIVTGECHYLWGMRHRLNVIERKGCKEVKTEKNKLCLYVDSSLSAKNKELILHQYYRAELKACTQTLITYWQKKIGVDVASWGIRKMKTKWGSCNTESKRILLNLELAKKPLKCLEYIIVHELIHLKERKHNEQFKAYMSSFLSDWDDRRELLNQMPLVHDEWAYMENCK